MNTATYNAMTMCKMNNMPPPKYIDEFWQHHGEWECKIYKLVDGDYQLVNSFFEYENASSEAKEIMNQLPKMKERIIAFLNLRNKVMVKAIELATGFEIQVVERPVYIINGAKRAYLSERAALNKLSSILTEREFREKGIETNYEDEHITLENGTIAHKRGEPTEHFMERKEAKYAELSEKLKKEREIKRLEMEYKKAKDKCKDADIVANEVYKKLMAAQNL